MTPEEDLPFWGVDLIKKSVLRVKESSSLCGEDHERVERYLPLAQQAHDEVLRIVAKFAGSNAVEHVKRQLDLYGSCCFFVSNATHVSNSGMQAARTWNSKDAGRESGKQRKEIADTTWRPHALELAKAIRKRYPAITQESLKEKIQQDWRLKVPCPNKALLLAIREWEKGGKLSRRSNGHNSH